MSSFRIGCGEEPSRNVCFGVNEAVYNGPGGNSWTSIVTSLVDSIVLSVAIRCFDQISLTLSLPVYCVDQAGPNPPSSWGVNGPGRWGRLFAWCRGMNA